MQLVVYYCFMLTVNGMTTQINHHCEFSGGGDIKQYGSTVLVGIAQKMTCAPKIAAQKKQPTYKHTTQWKVPLLNCFDVAKPRYSE